MSANTDETTQVDLSGEQTNGRVSADGSHLNGTARILWQVGADPDFTGSDEFAEVYERCVEEGYIQPEGGQ